MTDPLKASELEKAIKLALPEEDHSSAALLARLIADLASGALPTEEANKRLSDNQNLAQVMQALAGQRIDSQNSLVTFGEDRQLGDISIRDVAAGNLITINIHLPSPTPVLTTQERRDRQIMFNQVRSTWIEGVLKASLDNVADLLPTVVETPNAVVPPLSKNKQQRILSSLEAWPSNEILQIFENFNETLLILGPPGAGKTTLLLELCRSLLDKAEADDQRLVPVPFNLSTWSTKRNSISEWLAEELTDKYGMSRRLALKWVEEAKFIPLVDGLDEVPGEHLVSCIEAINKYITDKLTPLVVSSRTEDYMMAAAKLRLEGAVTLQPLTPHQVLNYLDKAGTEFEAVQQMLRVDTTLQEIITSPLMLTVLTRTYKGASPVKWPASATAEDLRKIIFANYAERMLMRRTNREFTADNTRKWLAWLAQHLRFENRTIFYLENLQPSWLETRVQRVSFGALTGFILSSWLTLSLVVALLTSYIGITETIAAVLIWCALILYFGLTANRRTVQMSSNLSWSISAFLRRSLGFGLIGLIVSLPLIVATGGLDTLYVVLALFYIAVFAALGGFAPSEVMQESMRPSAIIRHTLRNAFLVGGAVTLLIGLGVGIVLDPISGIAAGISSALLASLIFGAEEVIRFQALRFVLYMFGLMPWRQGLFLDSATERILLLRVGRGYRFVHHLLEEYFANLASLQGQRFNTSKLDLGASPSLWQSYVSAAAAGGDQAEGSSNRGQLSVTISVEATSQLEVYEREQSLHALDPEDAFTGAVEKRNLNSIAAQLGDVGQALQLAHGHLKTFNVTPTKYISELRRNDLLANPSIQVQGRGLRALQLSQAEYVLRTFALTYQRLSESDQIDVLAGRLLAHAAWFAPSLPISEKLLVASLMPDVPPASMCEAALERLRNLALLNSQQSEEFYLHPVVAEIIQSLTSDVLALTDVEQMFIAREISVESSDLFVGHLYYIVERASQRIDERAATLCTKYADLLVAQGEFEITRPYYARALAIREQLLGAHPDTARSLLALGKVLQQLGDFIEAQKYIERALAIREQLLGSEHPAMIEAVLSLGQILSSQNKFAQAQMLFERALATSERVFGPNHPLLSVTTVELAEALRAQREHKTARPLFERALINLKETNDSTTRAYALEGLGLLNQDENDLADARSRLQEALLLLEKAHNRDHPAYLRVAGELGLVCWAMGDAEAANQFIGQGMRLLDGEAGLPDKPDRPNATAEAVGQALREAAITTSRQVKVAALGRVAEQIAILEGALDRIPKTRQLDAQRFTARLRQIISREVGRIGRIAITEPVVSPYRYSKPVSGDFMIGREDIFQKIRLRWSGNGPRDSLLIHGHRRMGKTSIAQSIAGHVPMGGEAYTIYLTLESIDLTDESTFYYGIVSAIQQQEYFETAVNLPASEDFEGNRARNSLNRFFVHLGRVCGKKTVVLILDEFELLFESLGGAGATAVLKNLRGQTQTHQWFALALVGLSNLKDLKLSYKAPVYGWAEIQVGFLRSSDVAQVLTNPSFAGDFPLDYDSSAIDLIAEVTNGQPYLVQVIGTHLVELYNEQVFVQGRARNQRFTPDDVQVVLDNPQFYETASAYFGGVWGQVERGVTGESQICAALSSHPEGLTVTELARLTELVPDMLHEALTNLKRHAILEDRETNWHYTVPLMRRWVNESRPFADGAPASQKG